MHKYKTPTDRWRERVNLAKLLVVTYYMR